MCIQTYSTYADPIVTVFPLLQSAKCQFDGNLDKWCGEDSLPQEVIRKVGTTRAIQCTYVSPDVRTYVRMWLLFGLAPDVVYCVHHTPCLLSQFHLSCPSPFTPLLADLVCETDGELVARSGLHNPRESRASADLTARDAGTEWGPQQHMEDGVSVGGRG